MIFTLLNDFFQLLQTFRKKTRLDEKMAVQMFNKGRNQFINVQTNVDLLLKVHNKVANYNFYINGDINYQNCPPPSPLFGGGCE